MLSLQGEGCVHFWPYGEVASLVPEVRGRWRAVHRDGTVGHRPEAPPSDGPWLALHDGWVNPQWLKAEEHGYRDPAGFWWPGTLQGVQPPAPPSSAWLEFGFFEADVLTLRQQKSGCVWVCDQGEFPCDLPVAQAALRHSRMVELKHGLWVNRQRLRAVEPLESSKVRFRLDDGSEFLVHPPDRADLARRLGISSLGRLEPYDPALQRWGVRDYPFEIATAPAQQLREAFADAQTLIVQQVWQAVRYRQLGIDKAYGDRHRGFWYLPLAPVLHRGGWLYADKLEELDRPESDSHRLYQQYLRILAEMVGDDRLFRYAQLGFVDPGAQLRQIGAVRPEVVVYAEKASLNEGLAAIGERFGVTTVIGSGAPELLHSEYLSYALGQVTKAPLSIVGYVDYDVAGWTAARAFARQMQDLGHSLEAPAHMLLRAEDFTLEEQELYALPCPSGTAGQRELAHKWVAEGGGLNGQALGIHSDYVRPVERVLAAFERWWRLQELC